MGSNAEKLKLTVYYDGSCSECVKDRQTYEKLAGNKACNLKWFDISGKDDELLSHGIEPKKALMQLHVKDNNNQIHVELDAYILLMKNVPPLKFLAWLISLPIIRPMISRIYRKKVIKRLTRDGRL